MSEFPGQIPDQLFATLRGAFFLYYEATLKLDQEPQNSDLRNLAQSMALVIIKAFYTFRQVGQDNAFFSQVPLPPRPDVILDRSLIPPAMLFQALSEGAKLLESPKEAEPQGKSIYLATIGRNNVGKGVVTDYLQQRYGFQAHPLSDRVRELAYALGTPAPNRDVLRETGIMVKATFDAAVLIRHAIAVLAEFGRPNRLLFDGLRVEGEATGVLELSSPDTQAICVAVVTGEADPESDLLARYRRALARGGDKDPQADTSEALEQFRQQDAAEATGITAAMQHATHVIVNQDGALAQTLAQVDTLMAELGIESVAD